MKMGSEVAHFLNHSFTFIQLYSTFRLIRRKDEWTEGWTDNHFRILRPRLSSFSLALFRPLDLPRPHGIAMSDAMREKK